MGKFKKIAFVGILGVFLLLLLPKIVNAQISGHDLSRIGALPVARVGLVNLIAQIINILLVLGAVIAFLYLLWGGFQYLTAGANEEQATAGRKVIINAMIGIVIIFLSYGLVRFVISSLRRGETSWSPVQDVGELQPY